MHTLSQELNILVFPGCQLYLLNISGKNYNFFFFGSQADSSELGNIDNLPGSIQSFSFFEMHWHLFFLSSVLYLGGYGIIQMKFTEEG